MAVGYVSRLGVLGGTFDPPHATHIRLAEAARATLQLSEVLFVPAGDPWRKRDLTVSPAEHRLAMTKAAVRGHQGFAVSEMEVRRPGPTYTVDTLQALRSQGHDAIWFHPRRRRSGGPAALARTAATHSVGTSRGGRAAGDGDPSGPPGRARRGARCRRRLVAPSSRTASAPARFAPPPPPPAARSPIACRRPSAPISRSTASTGTPGRAASRRSPARPSRCRSTPCASAHPTRGPGGQRIGCIRRVWIQAKRASRPIRPSSAKRRRRTSEPGSDSSTRQIRLIAADREGATSHSTSTPL